MITDPAPDDLPARVYTEVLTFITRFKKHGWVEEAGAIVRRADGCGYKRAGGGAEMGGSG